MEKNAAEILGKVLTSPAYYPNLKVIVANDNDIINGSEHPRSDEIDVIVDSG